MFALCKKVFDEEAFDIRVRDGGNFAGESFY